MSGFTNSNRMKSKQFLQDVGALLDEDFDFNSLIKPVLDLFGDELGKMLLSLGAGVLTGGAGGGAVYALLKAADKSIKKQGQEETEKLKDQFKSLGSGSWSDFNEKDILYTRLRLIRLLHEGTTSDLIQGQPVYDFLGTDKLEKKKQGRLTARIMVLNEYWCNMPTVAYPGEGLGNLVNDDKQRWIYPDLAASDPMVFINKFCYELSRYGHQEIGNQEIHTDEITKKKWTKALTYFVTAARGIKTNTTAAKQQNIQTAGTIIGLFALLKGGL